MYVYETFCIPPGQGVNELVLDSGQTLSVVMNWNIQPSLLCYVAGKVKDVTQKYDSGWMTGTKKLRVDDVWWEEMLTPYHVKESKKTKQEDEKIKSKFRL